MKIIIQYPVYISDIYQVYTASLNIHGLYVVNTYYTSSGIQMDRPTVTSMQGRLLERLIRTFLKYIEFRIRKLKLTPQGIYYSQLPVSPGLSSESSLDIPGGAPALMIRVCPGSACRQNDLTWNVFSVTSESAAARTTTISRAGHSRRQWQNSTWNVLPPA